MSDEVAGLQKHELNKILPNIAFFDSGQGGLTVWESVVKKFPNLNTQYLGDNARCPYGNKGHELIQTYAKEAITFLAHRNAKLIIVACGTVSSTDFAVNNLKKHFDIPIVGIVEGLCQDTSDFLEDKSRTVAVLATRYTIKSNSFTNRLNAFGIKNVWARACPLFVPIIEEGISKGNIVDSTCDMYLWDIPEDVKIVLLACTHYPRIMLAIAESLERRLGKTVICKTADGEWLLKLGSKNRDDPIYLIESSNFIVNFIKDYIDNSKTNNKKLFLNEQQILCTDSPQEFGNAARFFTKMKLEKIFAVNMNGEK